VSLGVVLAILVTRWSWPDPAASLAVAAVIVARAWGLLGDSVNLALGAVPEGIDMDEVHDFLATLPAVVEIHDLHVWAMSTTETAPTAHLVVPDAPDDDARDSAI
jgi:cobalt-zinc-cadmium efflux system protein